LWPGIRVEEPADRRVDGAGKGFHLLGLIRAMLGQRERRIPGDVRLRVQHYLEHRDQPYVS
jgi:hypothetical protein